MAGLEEKVCRVANRISTAIGFVEGSTDSETLREMFLDGFKSLENMLFELGQANYRHAISEALSADHRPFPINADNFTRYQCELMHHVNLYERSIARLGDDLINWRPTKLAAEIAESKLSELEYVVACHADQLTKDWSLVDADEINQRVGALHSIANGLAIMVVNTAKPDERFSRLAIKYGVYLVDQGLSSIGSLTA